MSLNVFISGTSTEFRAFRRDLAEQLRRFRNLDIYPVVQEDLNEASTLDGATVDRLITNVRSCTLVVCLVGYEAGSPAIGDRGTIQKIAEQRLRDNFRKSSDELGNLWRAWSALGHGMTYTQLEFFLAASVFADQSRVRVCLPIWGPNVDGDDRERAEITGQAAYLNFLRQGRFWLDRVGLAEAREATVTLAVEFALQRRDGTYGISPHVGAREALLRSLCVLDNLNMRGQLTNEGYDAFYRAAWPRLDASIAVLDYRGDPIRIRGRRGPLLHLADNRHHTLVAATERGAHTVCFNDAGRLVSQVVHPEVGQADQPLSVSSGGDLLLTWSPAHGLTLHAVQRDARHWPHPQVAPDPFSRRPTVGGTVDNPWCVIWRGNSCSRHEFATEVTTPVALPATALPAVELIPLKTGVIELPATDDVAAVQLPVANRFAALDATCVVVSQTDEEDATLEDLCFRRIRPARVADLFLAAESGPLPGCINNWSFRIADGQTVLDIETIVADEICVVHQVPLPGKSTLGKLPILPSNPLSTGLASTIQLPDGGENSPRHRFPHVGRYLWSRSAEVLVHIEDDPARQNSRVRIWLFPRPMTPEVAGRFLECLQQLLDGERELPETGAPRDDWQRALHEFG